MIIICHMTSGDIYRKCRPQCPQVEGQPHVLLLLLLFLLLLLLFASKTTCTIQKVPVSDNRGNNSTFLISL